MSGLLLTVLELPVLWAPLGVGDSLLSSLLAVSELPEPELTPLDNKRFTISNIFGSFEIFLLSNLLEIF